MTSQPQLVPFPFGIRCVRCSAGAYHCAVASELGCVFTWGLNQDGQCGLPPSKTSPLCTNLSKGCEIVCTPHHLCGLSPVQAVSCGWSHTVALCIDGCVMVWGRCDYGQLGLEPCLLTAMGRCSHQPTELLSLKGARQVASGSEHNVAINGSGDVVTWGWNEHGMCGTGHEENVSTPYTLKIPLGKQSETVLVGSGAGHSMLVVRDSQSVL